MAGYFEAGRDGSWLAQNEPSARDVHHDRVLRPLQQRERRLGNPDDANGIGVEHPQRIRPIEREHPDAGVVDQDVQPAAGLDLSEGGGD